MTNPAASAVSDLAIFRKKPLNSGLLTVRLRVLRQMCAACRVSLLVFARYILIANRNSHEVSRYNQRWVLNQLVGKLGICSRV